MAPCILERALEFAAVAHRGQRRKDSEAPYIVHPVDVMKRLADLGVTHREVLSAAVLHDVVEDTSSTSIEIHQTFGPTIGTWVDELTFCPVRDTKTGYMESFKIASTEALAIKLCDRACNVDDYMRTRPDYGPAYAGKAVVLYRAVGDRQTALETTFDRRVADGLCSLADRMLSLAGDR